MVPPDMGVLRVREIGNQPERGVDTKQVEGVGREKAMGGEGATFLLRTYNDSTHHLGNTCGMANRTATREMKGTEGTVENHTATHSYYCFLCNTQVISFRYCESCRRI